jgi:hypothetical protein
LGYLYEFFTRLPFWKMEPRSGFADGHALCFAAAGEVYVFYLPHGLTIHLKPGIASSHFETNWFDPRTGMYQPVATSTASEGHEPPDAEDWTLLLRRKKG